MLDIRFLHILSRFSVLCIHLLRATFIISLYHRVIGLPRLLFWFHGCHSVAFQAHLFSSIWAICFAHLHFTSMYVYLWLSSLLYLVSIPVFSCLCLWCLIQFFPYFFEWLAGPTPGQFYSSFQICSQYSSINSYSLFRAYVCVDLLLYLLSV